MLHSHRWERHVGRCKERQLCLIASPSVHDAVNVNFASPITSRLLLTQARPKLTATRSKYQSSNPSNVFIVSHWENFELLELPLKALGSYNSQFIHLPLEETTLKVTTVCSLCLPWTLCTTLLIEQQTYSVLVIYFRGQNTTSQHLQVWEFGYWRCQNERHSLVTRTLFLPWWRPFFWYMLLGNVSLFHSDGLSILSCCDGVSCSLYSQKYLRLPLFREDIAVISFKSSTESFSYPKRMHCIVYIMLTKLFLAL